MSLINNGKISLTFAVKGDTYSEEYLSKLINGQLSTNYFSEDDGEIYDLVKNLYSSKFRTQESEKALLDIKIFCGILAKQLTGKATGTEKINEKKVIESYNTGVPFKSGIFSKCERNVLKEVAWIATHSYISGLLWHDKSVLKLIPVTKNIDKWNNYIESQDDIDDITKSLFIVNNKGECLLKQSNNKSFLKETGPKDDIPIDDNTNVTTIDLDSSNNSNELKDINDSCKAAIYSDNMEIPKEIKLNNNIISKEVPRLDRFTEIVNKEGYNVLYTRDSNMPGIIKAAIIDEGNTVVILGIDNCMVYGDTLRIISEYVDNETILSKCFVPISRKESITSLIRGTFSNENISKIENDIPKKIFSKSEFGFFQRIDMSGLMHKDPTGKIINGIRFSEWKKLVSNIYDIVNDKDIPSARYRIKEYFNPDKFILSCDNEVKYPFYMSIKDSRTNFDTLNAGTIIDYDNSRPDGEKLHITNLVMYSHL